MGRPVNMVLYITLNWQAKGPQC